jgi:putative ABC transport system substrate-binding protein
MKRREFVALLGGTVAVPSLSWPLAASAQQTGKRPTIGFFSPNSQAAASPWTAAFVERLRDLGWIEGRTVTIAYRFGEGRTDRSAEFLAEFVGLKVDVIVTNGEANIAAATQATSVIPIVFALSSDPVGTGLVASLARPGGNVTGLSILSDDLAGKRLELLRELVPGLRRLAIIGKATIAATRWRSARFRPRPASSASRPPPSKSCGRRTSRPLSRHSRAGWTHSMFAPRRW